MLSTISRRRRIAAPQVEGLENIISLSGLHRVNFSTQLGSIFQGNKGGNGSTNAAAIVQQSNQSNGGGNTQSNTATTTVTATRS